MDVILEICDTFLFDYLYASLLPTPLNGSFGNGSDGSQVSTFSNVRKMPAPASQYIVLTPSDYAFMSSLPRGNIWRQAVSLYQITWLFGLIVYFAFASLSYFFVFDHATFTHPKYLKNQISLEIRQAMASLPGMALLTTPLFLAEIRGYAKLYDAPSEAPFDLYNLMQFPLFIAFTDFGVYWIHRGLHHPLVYRYFHKAHHKWIMPTPYASHAFHPLDGFAQGVPYHVFPFVFPLQKFAYIILFVFINIWTVMIHDGEYISNSSIVNGAACHTMHHLYFNYNYGQFTTLWDRLGGSYRKPNDELFSRESKMSKSEWERQCREMEIVQRNVEGDDERDYTNETRRLQKKML